MDGDTTFLVWFLGVSLFIMLRYLLSEIPAYSCYHGKCEAWYMLTWGGALLWPFLGLPLASAALGKWARNHIKQEADNFYGKD